MAIKDFSSIYVTPFDRVLYWECISNFITVAIDNNEEQISTEMHWRIMGKRTDVETSETKMCIKKKPVKIIKKIEQNYSWQRGLKSKMKEVKEERTKIIDKNINKDIMDFKWNKRWWQSRRHFVQKFAT